MPPGASKTIALRLAWFVGQTNLRIGKDLAGVKPEPGQPANYRPWYAGRFTDINGVTFYWRDHYDELRQKASRFSDCFYDSTLPPEVIEAVAANLTILKSPTVLRQTDGRLWAWEGCGDNAGCCHGSCTHVWNYAQAIPHLFPGLERTLRETEFGPSQDEAGHQTFRSALPIRPVAHDFHAAADGQLGGIMKVYPRVAHQRRHRVAARGSGRRSSAAWTTASRPGTRATRAWSRSRTTTPTTSSSGARTACAPASTSARLQAAVLMGKALGDDVAALRRAAGQRHPQGRVGAVQRRVFHPEASSGRTCAPRAHWRTRAWSAATRRKRVAILEKEGPKYQYGNGCLADGVLGSWLALVCGVGQVLAAPKVASHLQAVHKYNLKHDLSGFANPQRPTYACGAEGGLLLCTWPKGGELSLPFVYSNEVWTGIEYQVASHLMLMGLRRRKGWRSCAPAATATTAGCATRSTNTNAATGMPGPCRPTRCCSGLSGARYDAVEKVLYLEPSIQGDFRCFLCHRHRLRHRRRAERQAVL